MTDNKKYIISVGDQSEIWDSDMFTEKGDALFAKYSDADVFEMEDAEGFDEDPTNHQYIINVGDQSEVWDADMVREKGSRLMEAYPDVKIQRLTYKDYWGEQAEANRAKRAELLKPNEERNAKLAEIGYYDDITGGQVDFSLDAPSTIGLKPLSSAVEESLAGETVYHDPRVKEFFANDTTETDRQAEIARLDAEYDTNPSVIAQREWEAKMLEERKAYAGKLEQQILKDKKEDVDEYHAGQGAAAKHAQDPSGANQVTQAIRMIKGEDVSKDLVELQKQERYDTALKFLQKAKIARDVAGKGFWGATIDWTKEGVMDAGTQSDIETYNEIGDILTRLEKELGNLKEENFTEEVFDKYLSKDEQALIKSFYEYNAAMADAQQDMSRAYKGGKIFAESVPFMLEFLATGGAYKAAGRAATSWMGKHFAKWIAKSASKKVAKAATKAISGAVKAAIGTAARTVATPGTYKRMAEASIEIDKDGHLNRAKNSAVAFADMYVENLSEISGDLIGELGKGAKWLLGKTPLSKIGGLLGDNMFMQTVSKGMKSFMPKLKALGFNGLPEEIGEEFIGNTIRDITNIQPGALKEMFEDDNFGAMLIGFAPMTMIGVAGGAVSLGVVNAKAAKIGKELREKLGSAYTEEELDHMMGVIQNAQTAEEIQKALKPMAMAAVNSFEKGMITKEQMTEQIEMLYQYGGFMAQNNALLFGKKAQDRQMMDAKREEFTAQLGRFWQEDQTETVQVATLNNGSTVFVTSAPAEDGKITIVDAVTGKKGFANVSDIATREVDGEQIQSSNSMTMDAFLNGQIAMQRKTAEETRMNNERDAQIDALRAQITPGTRINLGTEGSPVIVYARGTNKKGVVIVDETGMESTLGWEQAAYALGQPIKVETDQQKLDAEISERLQRMTERRMRRAVTPATEATAEAADEAAEVVAQEQQNIPLREDGTVDEALFWTQDPEGYVKWNDEQNKDGGQDSLKQIAISKQELFGMLNEAAAGQNTSNPTLRKAAEKQVAAIAEKIARLEALEMSYADALAEEKEAVKQTQVTPTATMSEEQLEQMDAQYQGILGKTRIQSERVRVMQEYLDKLAEDSVPVVLLTMQNYEERMKSDGVPKVLINAVKKQIDEGKTVAGFMAAGKVYLMHEGLTSIEDGRVTYVHERQHAFNRANPQLVQRVADALGNEEAALAILKTFVNEKALETYKDDDLNALADEIICRSMEIVYSNEEFSVDLQSRGVPSEVISIITEIDNEQRQDQSLSYARRRGRRNSYSDVSGAGSVRQDGRDIEQISEGVLEQEETRPSGSSGGGAQTGEGAEVISDDDDASFRIVSEPEEEEPSSPFMAAAQQEGESIRFSITTEESLQEKIRKFAKTKDGKATKWSEDDIESIIAETESLIDAIHRSSTGNEFYDEFAYKEPTIRVDWRDGEAKPIVTWTRANIEYKYDMSADLLCINNEGLEEVLSSDKMVALMEMFIPEGKVKDGEPPIKFTAEDYLELYNTLRDLGFVVPCKGCFDAAGRFKMLPSVAQKFAAEVNAVIDERNKDPKAFDEKLRAKKGDKTVSGLPAKASTKSDAIEAGVAGDNLTEHVKWTQLMSADGQTKMLSDWGGIFRAWQRTGAGRPKDKLLPEPYYGDIVSSVSTIIGKYGEKTPSFRDTLVNQGTGLRRNSHSEFRPVLAIDEIQFMRDAFIRNLTVFKYMKELDDVRLFGKMGVKFNMSFFPEYVPGTKVAGLDKEGNYIASEESVGSREFPYQGEDGKRHYDGMKGWAEAQKYVNKDVSLSSVIFSIPHLLKALTDVPTPSDMRGIWGSLIPFHSSGATTASLAMQGLGMARANGVGHGFIEAFTDYGKGVTNFEAVQNDRFGEGWYIVSGKKAGTDVEPGHKLEFANGNHYYNRALGVHLFASGYILDSELPEGVLGEKGELNITDDQKKALMHKFTIDYNDKVRELKGPYAYKAAADYYIAELPKLGLIPRFDFEVSEEKFLEMCEAANVDPRHPKLGWKGEGNSWSPIDSEAYYSLFCDYGMTDPATGEWAPHMPVGYVNEEGQREFRLPENAVEIVKSGLERFSEVRRSENARIDEAIEAFAERSVAKGRISQKNVDKVLGKKAASKKSAKSAPSGAIDLVAEAERVVAEQKQKEMQDGVALRVIGENETPREFLQKEVDAYRSRFNEVAPITLVEIDSKSQMARVLGMQETDLTDEDMRDIREDIEKKNKWGGYGFDSKEIAIFVREKVLDSKRLEMLMMHESIHALTAKNKDFLWLGQYMWVNAKKDATLLGFRSQIAKKEPKNRWYDEMAAYVISLHMENGTIAELESLLDAANRDRLNDLLNELGYDKESETAARDTAFVLRDNGYAEVGSEDSQKKGEEGKERVENEGASVSFRITPEQDKAYMDAVTAGDMETAQKMVIEAAKLAMPNTKVVDENGNPKVVYHGSSAMFTVFDKSRIGSATGTADGRGFYFTTDRDYALGYKTSDGQLFEVFLNIEKPLSYDKKTITKAQLRKILKEADRVEYEQEGEHYMLSNYANYNDVGIDAAVNEAANLEYDYADNDVELVGSLIGGSGSFDLIMDAVKKVTGKSGMIAPKDNGTIHYVVTDPAGIKSAEPVTYDNDGNVIPLSERFNPEKDDIRFRVGIDNSKERDLFLDPETNQFFVDKDIDGFNRWLKEHAEDAVRLYHGTGESVDVANQGLLRTTIKRRRSYQSTPGYVYLSLYPSTAQLFGELAYPYESTKVYAVTVKIKDLKPDTDQLANKRYYDEDLAQMGNTLAESLIYGGGARVKRNILPYEISEDIRFRVSNNNQAIFVSNAAKAVEGIKQEKATPEQWLKMIEKAGGLKAGEDKWMGLSDFLKSSDKKTLTKQEVLDFINENMIVIEETHYLQYAEEAAADSHREIVDKLQEKFNAYVAEYHEQNPDADEYADPAGEYAIEKLREEMEDTFPYTIEKVYGNEVYVTFDYEDMEEMEKWSEKLGVVYDPQYQINSTRLNYTTSGLDEKHEIALTVPTIESWNETDEVHFGEAGEGRAVAWIRFGDTQIINESTVGAARRAVDEASERERAILDKRGKAESEEEYRSLYPALEEAIRAREEAVWAWDKAKKESVTKKILVIDEIQSKRHQEGRDKGYKPKDYWPLRTKYLTTKTVYDSFYGDMEGKYGEAFSEASTEEDFRKVMSESDFSQMLRIKEDFERASNAYIPYRNSVPDAPFDKNWHELAMKRMLRYAAENGYDVIAWTKGDQQAERYNIGGEVKSIERNSVGDNQIMIHIFTKTGRKIIIIVDNEGKDARGNEDFWGKSLSEILGKEMADKVLNAADGTVLEGEGLKIGGEGMKGFYDKMLPAFMNKYGKKWGVKVEDIELPNLEDGLTMHSVPVTDEMKASVLEGQVMFRTIPITQEVQDEMDAIKASAIVMGNFMKAPNGKDTNLTPEQWAMVRTEGFKFWFGDWEKDPENASKVIDINGEPMVVYHGTQSKFTAFDVGYKGKNFGYRLSDGFYFSPDEIVAESYASFPDELKTGEVKAVFLNIINPLYIKSAKDYREQIKEIASLAARGNRYQADLVAGMSESELLSQRGYDGVVEKRTDGITGEIVVLEPNQIKSATDNTGVFSVYDDIRFKVVTDPAKIEELEDGPKVEAYRAVQIDKNGKIYSPMASRLKSTKKGTKQATNEAAQMNQWDEAVESLDKVDENGKITILDEDGGTTKVSYNPYGHCCVNSMMNDQFKRAWERDGLYVMKVLAPESELTAGYHAEKAKDAVGIHKWKTGAVGNKLPENKRREILLTRWMKNVKVMPWEAVAQDWIDTLDGENIDVPFNVVPRKILNMLAEAGVKIVAPEKGMENATKAYEQWLADPEGYVGNTELPDHVKVLNEETDDNGPENEPRFRVTGTPTDEVVANGLSLTPAQTAEVAANIFAALPEESRKKITDGLNGNVLGLKDAILQIPASLASKENWDDEDKQMAAAVREVVQDLVDANPTTRPLTTKEALWMLYDSTSKVKDLVDAASRAFVAYNLGFDPASMQRKQEVSDYLRFRTASNGAIDAATDMYNYETSLWTERLKESWLDMNQSVKSLQEALAQASGMPIEPWENIVFALNQLSSKSYADKKKYLRDFLIPLWDAVMEIVKVDGKSIEEIERYMMLKHGLERNKKFATRDAKEFYRTMYDLVAERMKNQSHAQQVVALSEAKKKLADIDAQIAVASSSQLPRLNEARARAQYEVNVADLVLRGDEKQNETELQAYYDAIDNEADPKYREFREKDYGGLTSMFVDTTEVQRSKYKSEEAYQKAVLAATTPKFTKVADMEAEAQAEVDYFEKVVGAKNLWDKVNAATKETLRHQYESGMITIEQYEAVRDMFDFYVPLRGFADNTAEDMYSYYMNNSAGGFTKPILGAKGRKTRAESPLGWIGTMAESAIQSDNKNQAKMALYYMTLRRPDQNLLTITETWYEYTGQKDANGKKIFKAAYPPATDHALNADELRQHMEDWEDDMKKKQSRGEAYKGSQRVDLKGSVIFQDEKEEQEHIIRVKVAGKDYSILINGNPRAAQAINGLLNPDANVGPVGSWVGELRRGMSSLLTSFSPLFWVANYQRDLLSSFMRTSESEGWGDAFKYLANHRKAWRVASYIYKYENGELGNSYYENLYKEFAENGGITGYTVLTTNKEYEKLLADYAENVDKKLLNAVKGAWDKFMGFGEAIEQVSRFAAYITARESGKSIEEAVNAAKEVSVNFNRKGSAKPISMDELDKLRTKNGKKLNAAQKGAVIILSAMPKGMKELYFFFNASVQALSSSAKLAKKSPGKAATWAGLYFGTSIAMAMINYLLAGDDDEEYLDLPDYLRHSTLLIKVSDDYYFKWSLPQEMRPFYAWADLLVSKAMGKMPHKNLGKEMALVAAQWLPVNPFDAEDPLLGLVPDYASPIAEAMANKTSFGGRIYDDMKFKSEAQREEIPAYRKATEKTGKIYVDLAELLNDISGGDEVVKGGININPSVVEHLVDGYGGGIYDFAKMLVVLPGLIVSDDPVEIKNIPFVNKVIMSVDETNMNSHVNDAFRYYSGIADNAKRVEKEYRESDDPSRADAYREEEDWRIYLLYKQYEQDFKDVKERLDDAVDKEEEDLLKQEQNVLREMFLDDIAKGDVPEVTFQIREDVKRFDKEIKAIMRPVTDANKERLEKRRAGDVDGMLKAIERRDSLKDTPEYQKADELNEDLKKIKQQLKDLGTVQRGSQRDSVIGELQKNYDAIVRKMEQL